MDGFRWAALAWKDNSIDLRLGLVASIEAGSEETEIDLCCLICVGCVGEEKGEIESRNINID